MTRHETKLKNAVTATLLVILVVILASLTSCAKEGISTEKTNNDEFKVKLLFEHDGIKVHRFLDAGHYVYYTNRPGSIQYETRDKHSERVVTENN